MPTAPPRAARLTTQPPAHSRPPDALPGRLRLPGLDPARTYRVVRRPEAGAAAATVTTEAPWFAAGGTIATGAVLERVGLAAPAVDPAQGVLLHLTSHQP